MNVSKEGKSSKKKIFVGVGIIAILLVMVGAIIIFSPQSAIYNGNMELSGVIITGEYVPFSGNAGDVITIEITNFQSNTGHGFKINLYGEAGISLWSRSDNKDVTYTIKITETQNYQLLFSVNAILLGGEVSFHLLVKKG